MAYLVVFYICFNLRFAFLGRKPSMAVSPKMLALIQKIEAADAEHFASLRESARRDAEAKVRAKKRAASRAAARVKNSPTP